MFVSPKVAALVMKRKPLILSLSIMSVFVGTCFYAAESPSQPTFFLGDKNIDISPCSASDPTAISYIDKPDNTAWFLPKPPTYPSFNHQEQIKQHASCISDAFERYVKAWFKGQVPAEIPPEFLPKGTNLKDFPSFRLVKPEQITSEEQWAIRRAHSIDEDNLHGSFPDPNATYLVLPALYAPFGTKVVLEGQFPHARFFSAQITPSLDPKSYHYDGGVGVGEVPIVDVDIEPLSGHTNPFRPYANRNASNRSYRLEFDLAIGDPVALNAAFRPPNFRAKGNRRIGSGILYQGPWGVSKNGHGRGAWDVGQLWLRYYAPDKGKGALAGVPLPKVHYELPDGRKYYVAPDMTSFVARVNKTFSSPDRQKFMEPGFNDYSGHPKSGWYKQTGIFRAVISGIAMNTNWAGREYVRLLDKGVAGRGSDLPPPNNYEQSATSATHIDYLVRSMSREKGKVVVLSGKLPTFPATRNGESKMLPTQMRYFSIVGYHEPTGWEVLKYLNPNMLPGLAVHEIMDDEIILNKNREYVIVLSSPEDRPSNATQTNGVTWVDWGQFGTVSWTLRWLSVGPEWKADFAPSPENLGRVIDWSAPGFKPEMVEYDNRKLPNSEYIPKLHYLKKESFEQLNSENLVQTFINQKYWE